MDDADGCAIAEAAEVARELTDWTAPTGLGAVAAGAGVPDGAAGAVGLVLVAAGWVTAVTADWAAEPRAWTAPLALGLAGAGTDPAWPVAGESDEEDDAVLAAADCDGAEAGAAAPEVSVEPTA